MTTIPTFGLKAVRTFLGTSLQHRNFRVSFILLSGHNAAYFQRLERKSALDNLIQGHTSETESSVPIQASF